MNHPSAPPTCVLGFLHTPSLGWGDLEAGYPGSGCPFHATPPECLDVEESRLSLVAWHWVEAGLLPLISLQRQNGPGQRVIPEANTTTRAGAFWGLAEDSDYTVQVRSIGLRGESPPWPRVHFRTLKGSDRLPSNSSGPAVIGLFCHHYDIIKDNDSNNNPKEKAKGQEQSPQGRPMGTRQVPSGGPIPPVSGLSASPAAPTSCLWASERGVSVGTPLSPANKRNCRSLEADAALHYSNVFHGAQRHVTLRRLLRSGSRSVSGCRCGCLAGCPGNHGSCRCPGASEQQLRVRQLKHLGTLLSLQYLGAKKLKFNDVKLLLCAEGWKTEGWKGFSDDPGPVLSIQCSGGEMQREAFLTFRSHQLCTGPGPVLALEGIPNHPTYCPCLQEARITGRGARVSSEAECPGLGKAMEQEDQQKLMRSLSPSNLMK
ncbi:hypothetical protein P7K49_028663 [Saguinus oedipus]|uniref:Uncharacterized protein n=1 Tax=Saguinus oedipus TaxID=9490 RepID=A0ABQ9U4Z5_SAGOE|nr:hypothetical protein P7K49_028663 [Saguinus oedipus]